MADAEHRCDLDCPAVYQIAVRGYLAKSWADWFDGMVIVPPINAKGVGVTHLTGEIVDQAALLGMLRKLHNLGLPLLSVKRIELD